MVSNDQRTGKQTIILILSWMGQRYNVRNWTSSYRDQKSTIKRCKWKGVDVSFQMKWEVKFEMNMVPKMGTPPTKLSNTVNIFQHHQPTIPPLFIGREVKKSIIKVNCSAIFKTNPTDRGMCCTFNALAAEEIYRWPASWSAFTCFMLCTIFMQLNIQLKWLMHPESRSSPSLLQICKKKMFATPSKIHLGCLKGEFLIQLVFSFKYFSWPEL